MERRSKQKDKLNKKVTGSVIIAFLFTLTLIGLLIPIYTPYVLLLFPFHLLLLLALLIWAHRDKNQDFKLFILVAYLAGFLIDVIGVNTGYIFGSFQFGDTLGFKLADVPLAMGFYWVILIYSVGSSVAYFKIQNHAIRALIGAFLLVFMNILMEPVAIRFDFCNWENMSIQFQNYVAWFVFTFCMLLFFYARKFRKQNVAAPVLLISQLIFFITLNLFS